MPHKVGGVKAGRGTGTRTMCIQYMTSLQTVHMFKDPRTVDQTEGAVQAQWYSMYIEDARQNHACTKLIENKGDAYTRRAKH